MVGGWFVAEQTEVSELVTLFEQSDTNGDGILDFGEWKEMVGVVDPKCDERTVMRMFKMTGEETESGEHVISPAEFVEVMRAHRYAGPFIANALED